MGKLRISAALPAVAIFLLSLAINSLHWLTLPPTPSWDAPKLGLYAHDLLQENLFPFYIYHQFGPHPLIVYLQAFVFAVFGLSMATLQSVTVVAGAMAAPAIFWASRWLFEEKGTTFAYRVGLIAALGYALSTNTASYSRIGTEPILLPVVEIVAVAFLWRGFRRGQLTDFVLAGLFVGVSQYVYIVARFFPVALAVATIGAVLVNRQLMAHWRRLICAAASSALVALPQWILFVVHPYTFVARVSNPAGPSGGQFIFELPDPVTAIAAKLIRQLLAISWHWDPWPNAHSSNPILTHVLVAGLVVGVAVAVVQRREGFVFGILMAAMMLLPDLLTYEKFDWHAIDANRLFPGIPFIFMIAGLGSAAIWAAIEGRRRIPNWVGYLLPTLVLASGLFRQWDYATHVRPRILASGGLTLQFNQIAKYIGDNQDEPILLPTYLFSIPPLAFLLAEHFPNRQGGYLETLLQGENVTVILLNANRSEEDAFPDEWVLLSDRTAHFFPPIPESIEPLKGEEEVIAAGNGLVVAKAVTARWQGKPPTYILLKAHFANNLSLVGYQSSDFKPGSPLRLSFYWQPDEKIDRDTEIFVQIFDLSRQTVVVTKHLWPLEGAYRVRAWKIGQTMPLTFHFPIPDGLAPGPYQLNVGLYDLVARKRIPLLTGGDFLQVKTFKVPLPADHRVPDSSADVNFGDAIALDGYTLDPASDGLNVTLFWRAIDSPESDYTSFVHIIDSDDRIVAQLDVQPLAGSYPTSIWTPGEVIVDEQTVSPIPAGEYRVYIGWYKHTGDGWERLPILSEGASPAVNRYLLDAITLP